MAGELKALVPLELALPCEQTDARVTVTLVVEEDPVRVTAPGLDDVKVCLAIGSAELVRSYCNLWTRWLNRACAQTIAADIKEVPPCL